MLYYKFKKGLLSLALIAALSSLTLTGCGTKEASEPALAEKATESTTTEKPAEPAAEPAPTTAETKEETAKPKELKKLKVAYNPGTGNILGFIAIDKGIAAEEGLDLELVPFSNTTDALNALQASKVDIAVSFGTAAPLTFVTKGSDFTIFGGYVSGGMPIYAAKDVEYKGLESFKGKKVATARMYTPDIVWRGAMMDAGYDLTKDVEILEFKKPTEVLEAVKSGKADIGIGTNSTYLQSVEAGLKTIVWSNELWSPVHVCCRPVSNTNWINENRDVVKAFLRTYVRAEDVLNTDPEYAVKMNMKYLELDEKDARTLLLDTHQIVETDPKSDGIHHMWDKLIDMEYIEPGDVKVDDHINIEIYKEAIDELAKEDPTNEFYKKLEDRFVEYNSELNNQ